MPPRNRYNVNIVVAILFRDGMETVPYFIVFALEG